MASNQDDTGYVNEDSRTEGFDTAGEGFGTEAGYNQMHPNHAKFETSNSGQDAELVGVSKEKKKFKFGSRGRRVEQPPMLMQNHLVSYRQPQMPHNSVMNKTAKLRGAQSATHKNLNKKFFTNSGNSGRQLMAFQ